VGLFDREPTNAHPLETPYDGVVDELQLSYHGSSWVTYPITPHFTTYEVGKYLGK
jgi:hypothetical protein